MIHMRLTVLLSACLLATACCNDSHATAPQVSLHAPDFHRMTQALDALHRSTPVVGLDLIGGAVEVIHATADPQQPVGAYVWLDGKQPSFAAYFGVTSQDAFTRVLEQLGFEIEVRPAASIARRNFEIYFRMQSQTLVVSDSESHLHEALIAVTRDQGKFQENGLRLSVDLQSIPSETQSALIATGLNSLLPEPITSPTLTAEALVQYLPYALRLQVAAALQRSRACSVTLVRVDSSQWLMKTELDARAPLSSSPGGTAFELPTESVLASLSWNLPIETDIRSRWKTWAAGLPQRTSNSLSAVQIENETGKDAAQSALQCAAHAIDSIASQSHFSGAVIVTQSKDRLAGAFAVPISPTNHLGSDLAKLIETWADEIATVLPVRVTASRQGAMQGCNIEIFPLDAERSDREAPWSSLFGRSTQIHVAAGPDVLAASIGDEGRLLTERLLSSRTSAGSAIGASFQSVSLASVQNPVLRKFISDSLPSLTDQHVTWQQTSAGWSLTRRITLLDETTEPPAKLTSSR